MPFRSPVADILSRLGTTLDGRGDRWLLFGAQALDVVLGRSGLELECLERAVSVDVDGVTVPVITVEDLVILKVLAGRPKDRDDVSALLRRKSRPLDLDRVRKVLGLLEEALDQSDLVSALEELRPRPAGRTARDARQER